MRVPALLFASVLASLLASAQTLRLPPRSPEAPTGSAFAASVMTLPRETREEQILVQISMGNVPHHTRNLVPLTLTETIDSVEQTITYYVLPDYLSIGSDDDHVLIPMTPLLAQAIADTAGCILPTRKMVNDIYHASPLKLRPQPIPPSAAMVTVPVFIQHNDSIRCQRRTDFANVPPGTMVAGHKKDVIISNAMYTNLKPSVPRPVVIFGWHRLDGVPIQPLYNGHVESYADYSHGIRLVQKSAVLNGLPVDLNDVLTDPVFCKLVSDEGPVVRPRYESAR
ncbi:MAG: hypothetical protein WBD30_08540 [Bacteroidota bacterium]